MRHRVTVIQVQHQWPLSLVHDYSLISRLVGTYGGPLGAAFTIATASRTVTTQFHERHLNFSFTPDNQVVRGQVLHSQMTVRSSATHTASNFDTRSPRTGVRNVAVDAQGNPLAQVATRVRNKIHWGGVAGATLVSGVLSGAGTFFQDLWDFPCMSPRERAARALTDGLYGLIPGFIGAVMFGGLLAVGAAPAAAFVGSFAVGAIASEALTAARKRYDLPAIR